MEWLRDQWAEQVEALHGLWANKRQVRGFSSHRCRMLRQVCSARSCDISPARCTPGRHEQGRRGTRIARGRQRASQTNVK
jgi:hypothetical protein